MISPSIPEKTGQLQKGGRPPSCIKPVSWHLHKIYDLQKWIITLLLSLYKAVKKLLIKMSYPS